MGILNQQLNISEKITAGDAEIMGQYPIKSSGYYADDGRYPDNRTTWAHGDVLTTELKGGGITVWLDDGIATSKTAGNLSSLGESEI